MRLPEYLLVTERGAWAMDSADECLAMARQMDANRIVFKTVRLEGKWA